MTTNELELNLRKDIKTLYKRYFKKLKKAWKDERAEEWFGRLPETEQERRLASEARDFEDGAERFALLCLRDATQQISQEAYAQFPWVFFD